MFEFKIDFRRRLPRLLLSVTMGSILSGTAWTGTGALGSWETLAPMPSRRQEVGVAELGGEVYVVAGFDSTGQSTNIVEKYNPVSNSWASVPPVPATAELNHVGVASASGRLYVVGGLRQNFRAVPWVFSYDPDLKSWREEASLPRARGACGVAVLDNIVYVAGGQDFLTNFRDFAGFDPATGEWTPLPDMPTDRNHLAAAAVNGRVYAISGRNSAGLQAANEVFSTTTGMWSQAAPIRTPRGGIAGAAFNGKIYIFGGEGNSASPQGTFEEVEEYDAATNSWRPLAPMPLPRHGIGAAVVGNRIHIPGGGPVEGFSQTNRHDAFRPIGFQLNGWILR